MNRFMHNLQTEEFQLGSDHHKSSGSELDRERALGEESSSGCSTEAPHCFRNSKLCE